MKRLTFSTQALFEKLQKFKDIQGYLKIQVQSRALKINIEIQAISRPCEDPVYDVMCRYKNVILTFRFRRSTLLIS